MSRIDMSGAEKTDTSELDSVTLNAVTGGLLAFFTSDTAQARSGARSWHSDLLNVGSILDTAFGTMTIASSPTTFAFCGSFYIDPNNGLTVGTPDVKILELNFGAATSLRLRFVWANGAATGTLGLYNTAAGADTTATLLSSFSGVPTAFWNRVQIRGTITTTPLATDTWAIRLNGVEQTGAAVDYAVAGLSSINMGMTGQVGLTIATSLDVFWDDIIVDNTNGGFSTIPDAGFLSYHTPTGADIASAWTTIGAGATHSARVADNSDATGVSSATDAQVETYNNTDISGTFPTAFTLVVAVLTSIRDGKVATLDTAGDVLIAHQNAAGANSANAVQTVTNSTTAALHRSTLARSLNPAGAAWSISDLNDFRVRLESDIGLAETVKVVEVFSYAEIQIKVNVDDPMVLTDAIVSISVKASIDDPMDLAETLAIAADISLDDALAIVETVSITVKANITDDLVLLDTPVRIIYVPQGTGGGGNIFILNE